MSLVAAAVRAVERTPLPDPLVKRGIDFLVERTRRRLAAAPNDAEGRFAKSMADHAIAEHAAIANQQHYELPPEFFGYVLGPRRKYSCCYYDNAADLAEAEIRALDTTIARAEIADGQKILELGCGWGSLTLEMAARFPNALITAVSNAHGQRHYIAGEAKSRELANVEVITADMNHFTPAATFDRIVSVEMFEHMSNWQALLARIRNWLAPEGRLFIHVFTHRDRSYRFDHATGADWIAQYFFTGGIMPSRGFIHHFAESFTVAQEWHWSGHHYRRTARDWLANFDANSRQIDTILAEIYGADAILWRRRWRLFFLATAQLFGNHDGEAWGVSHYLLRPAVPAAAS